MYSEVCAKCDHWEECETGEEFCTFELCIHFPEEIREQPEEEFMAEEQAAQEDASFRP